MKTKFTAPLKWVQTMVMMFFTLLFSSASAQNHPWFHHFNMDSTFHQFHFPNDTIIWFHNDSGRTFHDTFLFPPPPPHDTTGWNDSLHFPPPPPPPHDSIGWIDTLHFPPPPPPHDSTGDTLHFPPPPPHDSTGWGGDTIHFPPPPPPPNDSSWIDSLNNWTDSLKAHFPPPNDSSWFKGHRLANPDAQTAVSVSIYPNPVVEYATIHITNSGGNVLLRMYDAQGRLAKEQSFGNGDFQVTRDNLGAGLYYYEIFDSGTHVANGKLIFQ